MIRLNKIGVFLLTLPFLISSCSNDEEPYNDPGPDDPNPTELGSMTYDLGSVSDPNISGTARFVKNSDESVTVELDLQNTPAGGIHPAHIHFNTAAEGGAIAVSLAPVNGDTGESSITFTTLDDGTPITYEALLDFDGYINVHFSSDDLATLVAQGDIGQNDLTGVNKVYDLGSVAIENIDGTATFYERNNGEALAMIRLNNTPAGGSHPGHIHMNTAIEGGPIAFSFNPVNGDTGMSATNVATLDDGSLFGYDDVLDYNGYINIHLSVDELATLVAQGDIGQNELTGNTMSYDLSEVDVPGISGSIEFAQRVNETTLVTIALTGTTAGNSHPAHIHENDAATGGPILIGLNPVDGESGMSKTQVAAVAGGASISYADFMTLDAYVNVHLSADDLATLVAQGNIGSNVGDTDGTADSGTYDVTNSGASSYIFNGEGMTDAANPDFTFKRGGTYTFNMNTAGHPFLIKTAQTLGTGDQYNDGVANNGAVSGSITFTVPADAPDTLFYICEFHSSMTGTINIVD